MISLYGLRLVRSFRKFLYFLGDGERRVGLARWLLGAFAALPANLSSVLSTHVRWLTAPWTRAPGDRVVLFWLLHPSTCMWHTLAQIETHKTNLYFRNRTILSFYTVFFFREGIKISNPSMVAPSCNPSTEGSGVWTYLQLHSECKTRSDIWVSVSNKKPQIIKISTLISLIYIELYRFLPYLVSCIL